MEILKEGVEKLKSRTSSKERKRTTSENSDSIIEIDENVFTSNNNFSATNDSNNFDTNTTSHPLGKLLLSCIKNPSNKEVENFCKSFDDYVQITESQKQSNNEITHDPAWLQMNR